MPPHPSGRKRLDRVLAIAALLTLGAAWLAGAGHSAAELGPHQARIYPGANRFDEISDGIHAAWSDDPGGEPLGYFATGRGDGYNGPLTAAVGLDSEGRLTAVEVVETKETPSFFWRVTESDLLTSFKGRSAADPLVIGEDLDGVTGATRTAAALAQAVRRASRAIARDRLGMSIPPEVPTSVRFGVREVALLVLFALGLLALEGRSRYSKPLRWLSLLTGLLVLGFVFDAPLTVGFFSKLLLGYWPSWRADLYWILLAGGIVLLTLARGKNPYCQTFCPFGAAQECLGAIGGAKSHAPPRVRAWTKWIPRVLAWLAICAALLFRNPSLSSYEVFSAFFALVGATWQFAVLGLVLVASLFIKRPWCRYFCPVSPVVDFLKLMRSWIKERFGRTASAP